MEVKTLNIAYPNDRLGLMRHGKDVGGYDGKPVTIEESSENKCRAVISELVLEIPQKKLFILYSPLERAILTSKIVSEAATLNGFEVIKCEQAEWLESGCGGITPELLAEFQPKEEDIFTLLITHLDIIGNFLNFDDDRWHIFKNGSVFSQRFTLHGV